MREPFRLFFDEDYRLFPQGPNGTLYTAEYMSIASPEDQLDHYQVLRALVKGSYQSLGTDYSHDNADGYICLNYLGFKQRTPFRLGRFMLNPPNGIFYAWASGGLLGLLALPFLPISSIAMIISCLFTSYKEINGVQVLETDGILLARLRFNTFNLSITKRICDFIIKKKYGGYQKIFDTFYGQFHPISIISKERGL